MALLPVPIFLFPDQDTNLQQMQFIDIGCALQHTQVQSLSMKYKLLGVDGDALGGVVGLVDSHKTVGELEHVVAEGDNDELGVLGP